jgi:arylsulfatase A-like enzyme
MLASMRPGLAARIAAPLLSFSLVAGCGLAGGEAAPGVLVIVVDGLRADRLSCLGYDQPTTPAMDELAEDGVLFTQAFTASPLVLPAHVSLFTGCDPIVARRFVPGEYEGFEERRWRIPRLVPHMAVELMAAGYRTAAFLDDPLLDPLYGFGSGFQKYVVLREEEVEETDHTTVLTRRLLQWLRERDRDEKWFAYLHLADLERFWKRPDRLFDRYFPADPKLDEIPPVGHTDSVFFAIPNSRWRGDSKTIGEYEASYAGHLLKLNEQLRDVFARLRSMGRYENTTIVLVGSFGVQFGEAGLYLRAGRYSMADLHVPWIIRPRRGQAEGLQRGMKVDSIVSTIDLAPTLLALEHVPEPAGMHGVSQAAYVQGSSPPVVAPRQFAFASCGMQAGCAVIGQRFCLEYLQPDKLDDASLKRSWFGDSAANPETSVRFYDRLTDPYPSLAPFGVNLPDQNFQRLRAVAAEWMFDMKKTQLYLQRNAVVQDRVDEDVIRRLREKGYLGEGL